MCTVALALAAAGTAISAYGSLQAGKAQEQMYNYQATVDRNNAADAIERGNVEEERHRQKVNQIKASQRVGFAASGIDLGSDNVTDTLADTAMMGELDALTIRADAQRESTNFLNSATANVAAGKNARSASKMDAFTTILGGASTVSDKWSKYKEVGVK